MQLNSSEISELIKNKIENLDLATEAWDEHHVLAHGRATGGIAQEIPLPNGFARGSCQQIEL